MDDPAPTLAVADPLAHRALEALVRAETTVTRRLGAELDRYGVSVTGFALLLLLTSAGGELELRAIRRRLKTSKANATEVTDRLERLGYAHRRRLSADRRAAAVVLDPPGRALVEAVFPAHADRVSQAFGVLDDEEKRQLAALCRKLDRAA